MKRTLMTIIAILAMAVSAKAMSYEQARREALFLTDKMAYELNLNDRQYDAAYEINLDYLMSVASRDDLYGTYWSRRNTDFGHILLSWQWNAFCAASYFYRPLYWNAGYWHFGIYSRYPRRDYFYFSRPTVYVSYRGGHSWRSNGGRSYYQDRKHEFSHNTASHNGMRDRWNNGEFRHKNNNAGGSSTRITVNNRDKRPTTSGHTSTSDRNNGFGGNRSTVTNGNVHISTKDKPTTTNVVNIRDRFDAHKNTSTAVSNNKRIETSTQNMKTSTPVGISRSSNSMKTSTPTSMSRSSNSRTSTPVSVSRSSNSMRTSTPASMSRSSNSMRTSTPASVSGSSNSSKSSNGFGGRR